MSAINHPQIATFEASAAITKGKAVKLTASQGGKKVTQCSGTTDDAIGIAQNDAANAGDLVEVALAGGGGKALAKATIAAGNRLGINADGSIQKVASQGDTEFAVAMDDAVAGDIFPVMIKAQTKAYAAQA
jgi:hypothetical protein